MLRTVARGLAAFLLLLLLTAPTAGAALRQPAGPGGCASASVGVCGPLRGLGTPTAVAWSPDSRFAYVSSGYLEPHGALTVLRRGAGGRLKQLPGRAGCVSAGVKGCRAGRGLHDTVGVVVTPNGRLVIAASDSSFDHAAALSVFRRDVRTGRLTQLPGARGCISAKARGGCGDAAGLHLFGASSAALSADGGVLAVTENGGVTLLGVDEATGAIKLLPGGCFVDPAFARPGCTTSPALDDTTDVAIDADGSTVLAAGGAYGAGSLMVLQRGPDGVYAVSCAGRPFTASAPCTPLPQLATPNAIALTGDGARAYVASYAETSPDEGADEYLSGALLSLAIGPTGAVTALDGGCTAAGGSHPPSPCSAGRGFANGFGLALTPAQDGLLVAWGANGDGRPTPAQRTPAVEQFGVDASTRVLVASPDGCASVGRAGGCASGVRGLGVAPAVAAAPDGRSLALASFGGVAGVAVTSP